MNIKKTVHKSSQPLSKTITGIQTTDFKVNKNNY